jgi:exosortase
MCFVQFHRPECHAIECGNLVTKIKPAGLFLLLITSVALWWGPLIATFRLARSSDAYTYILLIVPLSVGLIVLDNQRASATSKSSILFGAILLSSALLLRICTAWNPWRLTASENLPVAMSALVIWWIGSVILCLGLDTFRSFRFPLFLLFLVVPMPELALAWVTNFLQQQSAAMAGMLFHLIGVPVAREGVILSIPGLNIEVAQECSSIRSSTVLVVMALVMAHLFVRSNWRKVLLVLASIPLSVLKNAIRILVIAELGTRVNPSFLHGNLHRQGGIVFLGLAVLMLIAVLWVLRKTEMQTARGKGSNSQGNAAASFIQ